jgi:uncharacterized membrane protein YjjP (DUF1212 family)
MEFLASLFVGKPLNIAVVAIVLLAAYLARRFIMTSGRARSGWLLTAAVAWAIYAGWERLVLVQSPDANIRVDLLLIYPALFILSAWALYRALR